MNLRFPAILMRNGGFALLDQFIFSGSSLLLVIVLARRADFSTYTEFITIYTAIQLIASFQNSLLLAPMSIYTIQKGAGYSAFCNRWALPLNAGGALGVPILHLLLFRDLSSPLVALASTLIGVQYLDLNYLRNQLKSSCELKSLLAMDAVASGVEILLILGAMLHGPLSFAGVTIILLVQWGAARFYHHCVLRKPSPANTDRDLALSWVRDHWEFGKWVLLETAPFWVVSGAPVWAISAGAHLADLPRFNTVIQITGIISMGLNAILSGLIPSLVSFAQSEGRAALRLKFLRVAPLFSAAALLLVFLAWGIMPPLARWLFGPERGGGLRIPFGWMCLALFCQILIMIPSTFYRISENTRLGFISLAVQASVMAILVYPLTRAISITGTALTIALSTLAAAMFFWIRFAMEQPNHRPVTAHVR